MSIADRLSKLPSRTQRMLALVVVPAAFLAIWAGVIWPISYAYQSQIRWRTGATHALARQRGLTSIEEPVRAQRDELPKLRSWGRLYRTNAQGSAVIALQSDVSAALTAAHARPQSFAPIEPTQTGPLRKVGLRVAASMTIDQLREFLRQAGELAHFVRIEQLIVIASPIQTPQENSTLTVTLDVFGFAIDSAPLEPAAPRHSAESPFT